MATLDEQVNYTEGSTTEVESIEGTEVESNYIRTYTIIKGATDISEDPEAIGNDYVNEISYGANGISASGVGYDSHEFATTLLEVDDVGRAISNQNYEDMIIGAKVKPYGDGSTYKQPSFTQDIDGYTTVSGLLAVVNSADPIVNGTLLATLPVDVAPNQQEIFVVNTDAGFARVDVKPSGQITATLPTGASVTKYISLTGLRFPTRQG
jgi:hypothetical protein